MPESKVDLTQALHGVLPPRPVAHRGASPRLSSELFTSPFTAIKDFYIPKLPSPRHGKPGGSIILAFCTGLALPDRG